MALKNKQITPENALTRLEDLCARSERCEHELREKLRAWRVSSADSEKILDSLRKNRYYDNARFAEAFVRDKLLYSRWGRRKIMLGLRAKRIDSHTIELAMDTIDDETYADIMLSVMKAKARGIAGGNSFEGRTKLYRFAIARGFEPSMAAAVIRSGKAFDEE